MSKIRKLDFHILLLTLGNVSNTVTVISLPMHNVRTLVTVVTKVALGLQYYQDGLKCIYCSITWRNQWQAVQYSHSVVTIEKLLSRAVMLTRVVFACAVTASQIAVLQFHEIFAFYTPLVLPQISV